MKPTIQGVSRRVDGVEVKLEEHTGRLKAMDAKIDDRFNTLDAKIDDRFNTLDAKIDDRFNTLDAKIDERFHTLDAKIDDRFDTLLRHIDLKTESIVSEFRVFRDELRGHSGRIDRLEVVADSHAFRLENLEK